jgi:hypothetical protein
LTVIVAGFVMYLIITKFKKNKKKNKEDNDKKNNNEQVALIPPSHVPLQPVHRPLMDKFVASQPRMQLRPTGPGGPYPVHLRPMQSPHLGMMQPP